MKSVANFFLSIMVSSVLVADSQTYTINKPNTNLTPLTGPYAILTVNRTSSTTANITFNSLTNGGYLYLIGDGSSADVNVNAISWAISGLTASNSISGFTPGPLSNGGSKNVSSFGIFNQTIDGFDGFTHSATQLAFTLTNTSGIWSSASNVLAANDKGYEAAFHAFACPTPGCTPASNNIVTGFAGANLAVPEPGTWLFLSSALLGFFLINIKSAFKKPVY